MEKIVGNITEQELLKLSLAKSQEEWNCVCDEIKSAHGGYPSDWWEKVKLSGLGDKVAQSFGQSFDYKIKNFNL